MRIRALVVDDSGFAKTLMVRALQKYHCEVVGLAASGFEAVDQFRILKPDLVTMDIKMAGMDGIVNQRAKMTHLEGESASKIDPPGSFFHSG